MTSYYVPNFVEVIEATLNRIEKSEELQSDDAALIGLKRKLALVVAESQMRDAGDDQQSGTHSPFYRVLNSPCCNEPR
jgi:hypothetical protein